METRDGSVCTGSHSYPSPLLPGTALSPSPSAPLPLPLPASSGSVKRFTCHWLELPLGPRADSNHASSSRPRSLATALRTSRAIPSCMDWNRRSMSSRNGDGIPGSEGGTSNIWPSEKTKPSRCRLYRLRLLPSDPAAW